MGHGDAEMGQLGGSAPSGYEPAHRHTSYRNMFMHSLNKEHEVNVQWTDYVYLKVSVR
jgi:hypothetical protein